MPDLELAIERYRAGVDAFVTGDPDPQKASWSRREDVTLANPLGPAVRGWMDVEAAMDAAAAQLRDGEPCRYDLISRWMGADLACILEVQSTRARVGATQELRPLALRVTTVFRLEDDGWKVVHRHADPLIEERSVESIAR